MGTADVGCYRAICYRLLLDAYCSAMWGLCPRVGGGSRVFSGRLLVPADDYSFIWPRWRRCTEHGEYHLLYVGCSGCQLDVLLSMESGRLSVVIAWGAVQEVCRPSGTGGRYAGVL